MIWAIVAAAGVLALALVGRKKMGSLDNSAVSDAPLTPKPVSEPATKPGSAANLMSASASNTASVPANAPHVIRPTGQNMLGKPYVPPVANGLVPRPVVKGMGR